MHTACHPGLHGGCTQKHSEQAEAMGGTLCSNKRVRWPLVVKSGCDQLIWITPQAGRELKPTTQDEVDTVDIVMQITPCDKEGCLASCLIHISTMGRGTCLHLGHLRLSRFYPRSRWHIIMNLIIQWVHMELFKVQPSDYLSFNQKAFIGGTLEPEKLFLVHFYMAK